MLGDITYIVLLNMCIYPKSQASIEALLSEVCGVLPDALKAECSALVKQYGPLVIQLLEQELQPDAVCKALGLCTSQKGNLQQYFVDCIRPLLHHRSKVMIHEA